MIPDFINGSFELVGSIMIWINIRQILKDKDVKGIHIFPTSFFFIWGIWNLFYYPMLDQWVSFIGGISLTLANGIWIYLMYYYNRKKI